MDDKDQELEFTLEDILKEFGSHDSDSQEPAVPEEEASFDSDSQESPVPEEEASFDSISPEFPAPEAEEAQEPEHQESVDPEDAVFQEVETEDDDFELLKTLSFEANPVPVQQSVAADDETDTSFEADTIRLDTQKIVSAAAEKAANADRETVSFAPITEEPQSREEPEEPVTPPVPEGAEPFSAGWEPEYEQPIGEYTPPEPIVFRPKSQLKSLKRKLVAGPERRYYALAETGFGKLQISIFLSLLVVVLGVASIGMYHFGLVQPNRMRLLVFGELFAMMFSALLASGRLLDGFLSLFKGKFTLDTLLLATFLVCIADGYFCLKEVRVPFCAAFCLEVTMSLWAEHQRRSTEMGQMDTLRRATRLNRVAKAPDCFEGRPGFYVTNGELEDFMDNYQQTTGSEKLLNIYALAAFLASGVIAAVVGLTQGVSSALQIWSAGILAATPATIFISQSRPAAILERRLHKLGTVLCGWQGIKATVSDAAVPLSDGDLFPGGSVKINGVKFYTNQEPDQVIAYATALITHAGNCLGPLFEQLLDERNGRHYELTSFRSYENGLGGEINGESVLVGTISFLQDMGVETPEGAKVNQAVYMAIDGELCAVFALAFGRLKGVAAGLNTLCNYRGLTPVLCSDNFLLSESFIHAKFGVNTRRFAFLTAKERQKICTWTPNPAQSIPCALTTQDNLASSAFAITGGRAIYTAGKLGAIVHILGGILGLVIVLALSLVHGGSLLTPSNLLLFELVWTIPGLLITEWTRNI